MSVEEVVSRLKVHEEGFRGYEDKEEEKHLLLTHEEWLARMKKNDAIDSSFPGTRKRDSHNKKNKGRRCGSRHGGGRGGKWGRDNTSQTYNNVNPWKNQSMIRCYSCGKYEHYVIEWCKKKRDEEANLILT